MTGVDYRAGHRPVTGSPPRSQSGGAVVVSSSVAACAVVDLVHAQGFEVALTGEPALLMSEDGRVLPAAIARWHAPAQDQDSWLLERCSGPTIDLGCGPGRLVAELTARRVPVLGVDCSRRAVQQCHSRGGPVLHRNLFAPLPGEGRWAHVLLADGNIGIGGDPILLLRWCAALLRAGGTVLAEAASDTDAPGSGLWRGTARLHHTEGAPADPRFPWAVIGLDTLTALAGHAGLRARDQHRGQRCFLELVRAGS